jgi:hypothetical protein
MAKRVKIGMERRLWVEIELAENRSGESDTPPVFFLSFFSTPPPTLSPSIHDSNTSSQLWPGELSLLYVLTFVIFLFFFSCCSNLGGRRAVSQWPAKTTQLSLCWEAWTKENLVLGSWSTFSTIVSLFLSPPLSMNHPFGSVCPQYELRWRSSSRFCTSWSGIYKNSLEADLW